MKSTTRDSNFELLRIILMFMIVLLHLGTFGIQRAINVNLDLNDYDQFFYHLLRSFSIVAVNTYVILSAYFLCTSTFKVSRLVRLVIETSFFAVIMLLLNIGFDIVSFDFVNLKQSLFAVFYREYWYVTVFFILLLVSPYLNKLINVISKKEHLTIIISTFLIFCIWGFFIKIDNFGIANGYSVIFFIFLYFIGSYIRKYNFVAIKINHNLYLLLFILLGLINVFIIHAALSKGIAYGKWYNYNSPIIVLMSYLFFKYFEGISINSKVINFIGKYVFGVYLIHEFPITRQALWIDSGFVTKIFELETKFKMHYFFATNIIIYIVLLIMAIILGYVFNRLYTFFYQIINIKYQK